MMSRSRKMLWGVGIVVALVAIPTAVFWPKISMILMFIQAQKPPTTPFAETPPPPPPDYTTPAGWAALPDRPDDADVVPARESDGQASAPVDVFFVHPTTYFSNKTWNAPLDDTMANDTTDHDILRNQASAFNACCRIYAPRYRQVAFGAQQAAPAEADQAWDVAYGDVRAAFDYYLRHFNKGRPFILASHSQGTMHALHLLEEFVTDKPLREQLVAAYLVGVPIPREVFTQTLPDIPLCTSPEQTGCAITWNAIGSMADTRLFHVLRHRFPDGKKASIAGKALTCTNPLTWKTDTLPGMRASHLGGVHFPLKAGAPPAADMALVDARCREDGWLVITEPAPPAYREVLLGPDMYHVYDYSLFYGNIRENARTRVQAFLQDGSVTQTPP